MIFANGNSYGLLDSNFNGNNKLFYALLDSFKSGNKTSPADATSVDTSKALLVAKTFNEHSERALMGAQDDIKCDVFNFIDKTMHKLKRSDFGYGNNSHFGISDTTGTASGHVSATVIEKAVLELIEKNELLMLWYGRKGVNIAQCPHILSIIAQLNFFSSSVDIFLCREVSNYYTIIVVLRNSQQVTASGIAISHCIEDALLRALQEAKLIEWCHNDSVVSYFAKYTLEEHAVAMKYIKQLKSEFETYDIQTFQDQPVENLQISSFVRNIYVGILNRGIGKRQLTIKCISEDLLNCLPRHGRIEVSSDKSIFRHIQLDMQNIKAIPDCILV